MTTEALRRYKKSRREFRKHRDEIESSLPAMFADLCFTPETIGRESRQSKVIRRGTVNGSISVLVDRHYLQNVPIEYYSDMTRDRACAIIAHHIVHAKLGESLSVEFICNDLAKIAGKFGILNATVIGELVKTVSG